MPVEITYEKKIGENVSIKAKVAHALLESEKSGADKVKDEPTAPPGYEHDLKASLEAVFKLGPGIALTMGGVAEETRLKSIKDENGPNPHYESQSNTNYTGKMGVAGVF